MKKYIAILFFAVALTSAQAQKPFSSLVANATRNERCFSNNKAEDVAICHRKGNHTWVFKMVSKQSVYGHFAHGDFFYRGRPDVYKWEMDDWCNLNAPAQ